MVKKKYLLSPSILSADFTQLGDQMKQAEDAGADWFHIDVMDGHFVPNISMGPHIVNACKKATDLPLDVHLSGRFNTHCAYRNLPGYGQNPTNDPRSRLQSWDHSQSWHQCRKNTAIFKGCRLGSGNVC